MTVKLNELQPVGEVASNPVQSHATYTIVFEFVKQNIMIDGIKGLRKIKENANGALQKEKRPATAHARSRTLAQCLARTIKF